MCGARVCTYIGVATNQSSLKSSTCGGFCSERGVCVRVCVYLTQVAVELTTSYSYKTVLFRILLGQTERIGDMSVFSHINIDGGWQKCIRCHRW